MNLLSHVPDNISEVLVMITRFTRLRQRLLRHNIECADRAGYIPQDLPVDEFAEALNGALAEHLRCNRLLFRDTQNIQFGKGSSMRLRPIVDEPAARLLDADRDAYLELQVGKLLENAINGKLAEQLVAQNDEVHTATFDTFFDQSVAAGDGGLEEFRPPCKEE
jgi:hypothetical protein